MGSEETEESENLSLGGESGTEEAETKGEAEAQTREETQVRVKAELFGDRGKQKHRTGGLRDRGSRKKTHGASELSPSPSSQRGEAERQRAPLIRPQTSSDGREGN